MNIINNEEIEYWVEKTINNDEIQELSQKLNVAPLIAKLLLLKKIGNNDLEKINDFIDPPKSLITKSNEIAAPEELNKAISRIKSAITNNERILINGDPDADGITGATILEAGLSYLGATVLYDFPIRSKEGHGLQPRIIEAASKLEIALILTVDCGTKDDEAIAYANSFNIDVIVCDHHILGSKKSEAYAMINPYTINKETAEQKLSGSTMAFKFIMALADNFEISIPEELFNYLVSLASLGALSDRVSLVDPMNRAIIKKGIKVLNYVEIEGLKALVELAGFEDGVDLKPTEVSKNLLPRLNAPGRIGDWQQNIPDSNFVVELLLLGTKKNSENKESTWFIRKLQDNFELEKKLTKPALNDPNMIEIINRERKKITSEIEDQIENIIKNENAFESSRIVIIKGFNWNSGVIGIDADRIKDRFLKPVIILTEAEGSDYLRASVRSIPSLDIYSVLDAVSVEFEKELNRKLFYREVTTNNGIRQINSFGGHAQACGFVINKNDFEEFKKRVHDHLNLLPKEKFKYNYNILSTINYNDINPKFIKQFEVLSPYGQGFDLPIFRLCGCYFSQKPRPFGNKFQKSQTPHVEFTLWDNNSNKTEQFRRLTGVGFGLWHKYKELVLSSENQKFDLIFNLDLVTRKYRNNQNAKERIVLNVLDIKKSC
ncbi:MAG: DHH family phosphoesterase [Candidatus Margulisiibacteriota bacterium]|jgi:single-stranded-DNA-specific exonuclease